MGSNLDSGSGVSEREARNVSSRHHRQSHDATARQREGLVRLQVSCSYCVSKLLKLFILFIGLRIPLIGAVMHDRSTSVDQAVSRIKFNSLLCFTAYRDCFDVSPLFLTHEIGALQNILRRFIVLWN